MINVVAASRVPAANLAEYKRIAAELVAKTKLEDGCLAYDLFENAEDETALAFLESWESQAHLDAHMQTEHFLSLLPKLNALAAPDGGSLGIYKPV